MAIKSEGPLSTTPSQMTPRRKGATPVLDGVPPGQLGIERINNNALPLTRRSYFHTRLAASRHQPSRTQIPRHSLDSAPIPSKDVVIECGGGVAFGHWLTSSNSQVSPTRRESTRMRPRERYGNQRNVQTNFSRRSGVRFLGDESCSNLSTCHGCTAESPHSSTRPETRGIIM